MNTFKAISRGDKESLLSALKITEGLANRGWTESDNPELAIAVGGDGTMLEAFRRHQGPNTVFVGLNMGTLGFFADWNRGQDTELIAAIAACDKLEIAEYPLVSGTFQFSSGEKKLVALNDIVVKSRTASTFVADIRINDAPFESFRGDGLIFASPSGSSAYAFSVGGAIIHPSLPCVQMCEIASINNRKYRTLSRPLVIPSHHHIDVRIQNPDKDVLVVVDGIEYSCGHIESIKVNVAEEKVKFARYRQRRFFDRVRDSFISE